MEKYRTITVVSIITFLLLVFTYVISVQSARAPSTAEARALPQQIEYARTPEAQAQGLSGRAQIPPDYGMLFVFPAAGRYGFWMKDMLVPIDIIWIREDGVIVGREDSVSPDTYPKIFTPPEPVRAVLEVRAGESRKLGYEVGTKLALPEGWQK